MKCTLILVHIVQDMGTRVDICVEITIFNKTTHVFSTVVFIGNQYLRFVFTSRGLTIRTKSDLLSMLHERYPCRLTYTHSNTSTDNSKQNIYTGTHEQDTRFLRTIFRLLFSRLQTGSVMHAFFGFKACFITRCRLLSVSRLFSLVIQNKQQA